MQNSEVARLLTAINSEYAAAERGLSGLAYGTAKHEFITNRTVRIAELHAKLRSLVSEEEMVAINKQLDQAQ